MQTTDQQVAAETTSTYDVLYAIDGVISGVTTVTITAGYTTLADIPTIIGFRAGLPAARITSVERRWVSGTTS